MGTPQQPEIRRSGRGEVDPQGRRVTREANDPSGRKRNTGKVPEENTPGHKPEEQQDKPSNVP